MAESIRAVKTRIIATKKTSQITKAMNMVSASKLRLAEKKIKAYRPFIAKVEDIIVNIAASSEDLNHPLLTKRTIKKTCYVVISSDRGLAGAFNANVLKELTARIIQHTSDAEYVVLPLGYKAYSYAKKKKYPLVTNNITNLPDDVDFRKVDEIVNKLVVDYLLERFDKVIAIYNHYVNPLIQKVAEKVILPVEDLGAAQNNIDYDFEGGVENILDTILPIYLGNAIYGLVLDSKAGEHAARMNSMQSATDNATSVIASLELLYNRARQAAITSELTDIVGGASVINES